MKPLVPLLLLLAACGRVLADTAPPTDASIRELIAVTQSRQVLDSAMGQVDAVMQAAARDALAGQPQTEEQKRIVEDMRRRMAALFREEIRWEALEPGFVDAYRKSFSQAEIDAMIAFYKSPAGQAVITRMPAVMQQAMATMEQRMQALMPRLLTLQQETVAQLRQTARP